MRVVLEAVAMGASLGGGTAFSSSSCLFEGDGSDEVG